MTIFAVTGIIWVDKNKIITTINVFLEKDLYGDKSNTQYF